MPAEWFYAQPGGEKSGPVDAAVLNQKFAREELSRQDTLVWKRGMTDWLPADDRDEFTTEPIVDPTVAETGETHTLSPEPTVGEPGKRTLPLSTPHIFTAYAVLQLLALILLYRALVQFLPENFGQEQMKVEDLEAIVTQPEFIDAAVPAFIVYAISAVLSAIVILRAWSKLRPNDRKMPKLAAGLMLVPFFNLFWRFIAYWKWSQEWNSRPELNRWKQQPERIFLYCSVAVAMGSFLPIVAFVGLILNWISLFLMSRAAEIGRE